MAWVKISQEEYLRRKLPVFVVFVELSIFLNIGIGYIPIITSIPEVLFSFTFIRDTLTGDSNLNFLKF